MKVDQVDYNDSYDDTVQRKLLGKSVEWNNMPFELTNTQKKQQ